MLPPERKILKASDWQKIHRRGRVQNTPSLILKTLKNNKCQSRFGFSISLKTEKKAVIRNKIRRQWRAIMGTYSESVKQGFDIIFIARRPIIGQNFEQIKKGIATLMQRAKLLK